MMRRKFITLLGGAAAWPVAARAQSSRIPVIGVMRSTSAEDGPTLLVPFNEGLREVGYIEGVNCVIDFRAAENLYDRLPAIAAELVRAKVDVIVPTGAVATALAAKAVTTTVPIVFVIASDPIRNGLVNSISRPEGNVTGVLLVAGDLIAKRLQLLREIVPDAKAFGFLINPSNPNAAHEAESLTTIAAALGLTLHVVEARSDPDLGAAFVDLARTKVNGFLYSSDVFFQTRVSEIATLAKHFALPGIYTRRDAVIAGGLIAYGSRPFDTYRTAGIYTGRILKGAKPADLPVQQPTKFEFVINLKTATALGIVFPPGLLAIADEVIE